MKEKSKAVPRHSLALLVREIYLACLRSEARCRVDERSFNGQVDAQAFVDAQEIAGSFLHCVESGGHDKVVPLAVDDDVCRLA